MKNANDEKRPLLIEFKKATMWPNVTDVVWQSEERVREGRQKGANIEAANLPQIFSSIFVYSILTFAIILYLFCLYVCVCIALTSEVWQVHMAFIVLRQG